MKVKDLDDASLSVLKITDFEHFFDVYLDQHGNYAFNLNQGLYFKFDKSYLPTYECIHQMFWPLISYQLYGTTRLAWMLMKLNDVTAEDMFKPKNPGDKILYLPQERIQQVVDQIVGDDE